MSVEKMNGTFTPKIRKYNLVIQELEGEVLIYDLEKNKAYCLNETSALVWRFCDGSRTIAEISDAIGKQLNSPVGEDIIWLALDKLSKENLIEKNDRIKNKFDGLSRREVVKKIGLASLVALPVIVSLTVPVSAQTGTCTPGGSCSCVGPNTGQNMICTPATSTCNPNCVCRFANNGNNNGTCAVP